MTWFRTLGLFQWMLISAFLILYLSYLFRVISAARKLQTSYSNLFKKLPMRTLYFILMIVALLGPSFGESKREVKAIGKDIYMCVDLSESMNANDIQPTRLEKVKFELKNIVNSFSSDRVGLIIFSSEAFVQCPLTFDQSALHLFIESLGTGLVPSTGTDFTPPVKLALDKLKNEKNTGSQLKSKVIILISDGEDFGDNPEETIREIQDSGIKLFTLGVGTEKGSRIPTRSGYKIDKNGREVLTRLNARNLKTLAIRSEGKYFEINDSQNDINRLITAISQIEGETRDSRFVDVSSNKYYYFLAAALLLIFLDTLFPVKTIRI